VTKKGETLKKRVRDEVIAVHYPEFLGVEPTVKRGPSESRLRSLRRMRGALGSDEMKAVPLERTLTYHLPESAEQPFDKTVVVVTDDDGRAQFIIESK